MCLNCGAALVWCSTCKELRCPSGHGCPGRFPPARECSANATRQRPTAVDVAEGFRRPPTATEAVRPAQTASDVAEGSRPRSTAANPPKRCNICGRFVPAEGPWPCTYYDSYTGGWEHE